MPDLLLAAAVLAAGPACPARAWWHIGTADRALLSAAAL